MANQYVNKVQTSNGNTLIDLTGDTVTADKLMQGYTAHDRSGAVITGTATGGGSVTQDQDGYIVLDDDAPSGSITVESLSVTSNGTYTAPSGKAYSPVTVNVSGGGSELKSLIDRSITSIDLPNDLTAIGEHAFHGCPNLTITSLPSGITSIGSYAFYGATLSVSSLPSGITTIGDYAFANQLFNLNALPSGITSIGSYAFLNCTNLSITNLPSTVTSIGSGAFSTCINLVNISCNGNITTLNSSAFTSSTSIKKMKLETASFPNLSIATMQTVFGTSTATNACQKLAFADIGSINTLGANSFANCYALETLVLRNTSNITALANVSAFLNTPMRGYGGKTGTVYVPEDLITSYQTATNWSTLYNGGTVEFKKIEGSIYEL